MWAENIWDRRAFDRIVLLRINDLWHWTYLADLGLHLAGLACLAESETWISFCNGSPVLS